MRTMFIITGAAGHLGSTIIRELIKEDVTIRGLVLPGEERLCPDKVTYFEGDITEPETMEPFFSDTEGFEVYCIHTAGIISIADDVPPIMMKVNVEGTGNVVEMCKKHGVKRLVYTSSVHAIPEGSDLSVIREISAFDPEAVVGGYAKTKAMATQLVMDGVHQGLDAVVVHPSGILGPYDSGSNHMVQLIKMCITNKLPASIRGGFDFVDVRDVAQGCINAALNGKKGACYILSNRYVSVKDLVDYARKCTNGRKKVCLPMSLAKAAVPFFELSAKVKKTRPLFTKYSLRTLESNACFSHDRATVDLHYQPRDIRDTIRDTVNYLKSKAPKRKKRRAKAKV